MRLQLKREMFLAYEVKSVILGLCKVFNFQYSRFQTLDSIRVVCFNWLAVIVKCFSNDLCCMGIRQHRILVRSHSGDKQWITKLCPLFDTSQLLRK